MGADLDIGNTRAEAGEPTGDVVARTSELRATEVGGELIRA